MPATPADALPRGAWWEAFGDPTLTELERQLSESNPDLQAAVARFEEARGVAIRARSDIFPSVGASASAKRGKSSANAPLTQALGGGTPGTQNDFLAALDLSWEVDLFGRLRNTAAAAGAQAQASAADLAAVQLALQAELATDYFSLRGDDTTVQLLQDTIKVFDRAYELTHNRYQEGISAATDVDQADTLRQNARAQLAAVISNVRGWNMPLRFCLERYREIHARARRARRLAAAVRCGLPSKLLERRPDVGRAERTMAAANAQIGVARAAWFPVFTLSGAADSRVCFVELVGIAPSHFWSVGPGAGCALLDAGAPATA